MQRTVVSLLRPTINGVAPLKIAIVQTIRRYYTFMRKSKWVSFFMGFMNSILQDYSEFNFILSLMHTYMWINKQKPTQSNFPLLFFSINFSGKRTLKVLQFSWTAYLFWKTDGPLCYGWINVSGTWLSYFTPKSYYTVNKM